MGAVFIDRSAPPDDAAVERALGPASALWRSARERVAAEFGPIAEEWAWSGKAAGWSLRLKRGDRAIVYLTPHEAECRAAFALGEKAVTAAGDAGLSAGTVALLEAAPRYPEGRAVRFVLTSDADVDLVCALARVKLAS